MPLQFEHGVLPKPTADEEARQEFVFSMAQHSMTQIMPGIVSVYEKQVLPEFKENEKREPATRHEIRRSMQRHPYYQLASSFQRSTQELLWDSVDESVQRQLSDLITKAEQLSGGETLGNLTLDPEFEMPRYIRDNDHHVMPGGYAADLRTGDITAGALYDRGAYIFTDGLFGEKMDGVGKSAAQFIRKYYPDIAPQKIIDFGSGMGGPTCALKEAFPEAEVCGIDVSAAELRYSHARAESLGVAVHFSQQNAERTNFEDGSVDVVVSVTTFHETSRAAVENIIRDAYRILKSGGALVVGEQPPFEGKSPFEQFLADWDTLNNNEPFWSTIHEMDMVAICSKAGFKPEGVFTSMEQSVASTNAVEANADPDDIVGSDRGGGDFWYFSARK
ncbi:MAG: class I SAM-dependent methyltransferase [Rhodospirillaceae bacterium]|jgi:SAM-dependent methyltransferase|nr:class I SAM-dependent methyltransferase [Rhodospirillaceae bacterium]